MEWILLLADDLDDAVRGAEQRWRVAAPSLDLPLLFLILSSVFPAMTQ